MPEHKKLWNDWRNIYYLDLLEKSLNVIPIPCPKTHDIPFNSSAKKFDLTAARMQYDFMKSVEMHQNKMPEIENQMSSMEKELDRSTTSDLTLDSGSDCGEDEETSETVKNLTSIKMKSLQNFAQI